MIAIYAPGGGRGHVARARAIAARLSGEPTRIHGDGDVPREGDTLIVDTFPTGRRGEITDEIRARFRRRILVRRYVRPGALDDLGAALVRDMDVRDPATRAESTPRAIGVRDVDVRDPAARLGYEVWLPYVRETDEWDGAMVGTYVGPLVRQLRIEDGPEAPVAVLGDLARLPWRPAWPAGTRFVAAWDDAIPRAARYVVVGAGHNTVYELRALGVSFAAYPLDRRYDDQHRRAARLGIGVWTPEALARFVA